MEIILADEHDTARFAKEFYAELKGGESIGLIGQLGAGKTAFVRHFAVAAGVPAGQVSSPSFVLSYEYTGEKFKIEHWDIYRLPEEPDELSEPPAKDTVRLIEWADRSDYLLSTLDYIIRLNFTDIKNTPDSRHLILEKKNA